MNARHVLTVLLTLLAVAACRRPSLPADRDTSPAPEARRERVEPTAPRSAAIQSYADMVDRVAPAVVTVRSSRRVRAPQQFPFFNDPFFRRFFEPSARDNPPQVQRGLGSGVVVSSDGRILTNHHVIDGAEEILVDLIDRRSFKAKLVGSDAPSDLAVLETGAKDLTSLRLGNSDAVRVGDIALAVGNPLGLGQTVTAGIISAKGRSTGLSDGSFEDFLQTDAPINRGNSGGALVNTAGELIGINSQILSPSGGNIGIGFAIPSNMAKSVMNQLVSKGRVERGQLGVAISPVTEANAASVGLDQPRGVLINSVARGSAAERGGLQAGDVLIEVNGEKIYDGNVLRNRIASAGPGAQINLMVLRDGKERDLKVKLDAFRN